MEPQLYLATMNTGKSLFNFISIIKIHNLSTIDGAVFEFGQNCDHKNTHNVTVHLPCQ